jgi:hypothetical protein
VRADGLGDHRVRRARGVGHEDDVVGIAAVKIGGLRLHHELGQRDALAGG